MADKKAKVVSGVDRALVHVKGEYDDKPRTVAVNRGEELPGDLLKNEEKRLEDAGVFGEYKRARFQPMSADEQSRLQILAAKDEDEEPPARDNLADEVAVIGRTGADYRESVLEVDNRKEVHKAFEDLKPKGK